MKITNFIIGVLASTLLFANSIADTTITNSAIGISAYLPDNWTASQASDTGIFFSDTTFTYRSQIVIKKYPINQADYPSATDWTRAHFIGYLLVVQYSFDPFGAVLYFDSSATCKQDSLWAPEAFSEFYTIDTVLGAWDEYIRFTESGSNGYEIYAIGDTADMKQNIGLYMAIIRFVHIDKKNNQATAAGRNLLCHSFTIAQAPVSSATFDLLGKKRGLHSVSANGIYYRPEFGRIQVKVK